MPNRFAAASLLLGCLLIIGGLWWMYRPLGVVFAGLLLVGVAAKAVALPGKHKQ